MSDRTMQADPSDDALVSAIDRWSAQATLSDMVGRRDAAFLVLDAGGDRVLYASPAALSLQAGLAGADGLVARTLSLSGQIGGSGRVGERPRLARLRLDPRGIARPVTCLVARAALDEVGTVLVLAPVGPVPAFRPLVAPPDRPPSSPPPVEPIPSDEVLAELRPVAPRQDGRLVWRSDGDDVVRLVSGDAAVSGALTGRSWPELFARGLVTGEALSAAIAGRVTFRAVSVVLAVPGTAEIVEADLSGAPSARAHQPYAGFSGFGIVRARRTGARSDDGDAGSRQGAGAPDAGETPAEPAPEAGTPAPTEAVEATVLSASEHAAFREIARSLGVRFAGDEEATEASGSEAVRSDLAVSASHGSVTPFPASSRLVPAAASAADLLDGLPVGVMIHRGEAPLFANSRLLALTGFSDLAVLQGSDAAARLVRAAGEGGTERPVPVPTASGETVDLTFDRAGIAWEGAPASLLLVRAAPAGVPPREPAIAETPPNEAADAARGEAAHVLDSLPDGVLTLDETGRVLGLNGRAAILLEGRVREIVGHAFPRLFPRDAWAVVEAALARAGRGGMGEADIVSESGEGVPVPLSVRIARLPEGGARFCAALRDRSDEDAGRAELNRQAEALAARKADFLAKVGHEIRTPLNTILECADLMLNEPYGPLGPERIRESLRDIHASGSQTLRVVDDLLDLARIEAGRGDLRFTDIPLNELVSGCIATMQPQAARDRIVVRTSLAPDLKTLVADERSMRQAALTVIANAIRFTEAGGQVIVSTMIAERGEIALRVRDTGVGMTSEEVESALRPFDRIGVAGPAAGGGSGLGLTLTKALVEANRGRFRITSRKHEGTLVEMVFPAAEALRA